MRHGAVPSKPNGLGLIENGQMNISKVLVAREQSRFSKPVPGNPK